MTEETITTLEEIKAELRREGAVEELNRLLGFWGNREIPADRLKWYVMARVKELSK